VQAPRRLIGWSAEPLLNLDLEWSGANLGLQGGPLFGDKRLHRYYYDVTAVQATGTRPAYSASGGYAGWQATAGMSKRIGQFWLGAFLRYDTVAGAVFEDSPLVKSRGQLAYGLAVSWIFAASDTRVADRR
jgi:outer membrane scaffolding protein for murein synthesis (MipA/OmpV family)